MIMRLDLRKIGFIVLTVLALLTSASAFQYDFERSGVTNIAENSSIQFTELEGNTEYTFRRGDDGRTINTFTTSSTGVFSTQFNFRPIADGYENLSSRGFYYQLESSSAPNQDIFLHPGYFLKGFDTFKDGLFNDQIIQDVGNGVTESSSKVEFDLGKISGPITYNRNISEKQALLFEGDFIADYGGLGMVNIDLRIPGYGETRIIDSSGGTEIRYENQRVEVYYNESAGAFDITAPQFDRSISAPQHSGEWTFEIAIETNQDGNSVIRFDNIGVIPRQDLEKWDVDGDYIGHEPRQGLLNYELGGQYLTDIEGFPVIEWAGYTEGISDQGFFSFNFEDDVEPFPWSALAMRNTENGSADYLSLSITDANTFEDLRPQDGFVTQDRNIDFSFNWNFGDLVEVGDLRLQFDDGDGFETVNAVYSSEDGCSAGSGDNEVDAITVGNALFNTDCGGDRITASVDVTEYVNSTNWRFQVFADNKNFIYNSEERSFSRSILDSTVTARSPINGTTFTTLKPRFIGRFATYEPGSATLDVDGTTLNSWVLRTNYNGELSYIPSTGLSEGSHSYQFAFEGLSGITSTSETKTFDIDTSKADELNISILSPQDNQDVITGDVPLEYKIESTQNAEASIYLDDQLVATENINSGGQNYTTEIRDLEAGTHTWFILVNQSNLIYQSDISSFEVVNNVSFDLDEPENDAQINSPPIIFNGTVSSTGEGTAYLSIDGERITSTGQTLGPGDNISYEFERDENISSGKHTYRILFETDGEIFRSSVRTFNLELGTTETGAVVSGGFLREIANTFIAEPLGITPQSAINIVSLFLALMTGGIFAIFVDGKEGEVFAITSFTVLTVFSIAGMFPLWIPIGIIVVGAGLFAYMTFG